MKFDTLEKNCDSALRFGFSAPFNESTANEWGYVNKNKAARLPLIVLLVSLLMPGIASAQLTTNLSVGNAKAMALANAVTADPPGIDSIHFNPAGLARLTGRQRQFGFFAASFKINDQVGDYGGDAVDFFNDTIGINTEDDPIPNSGGSLEGAAVMLPFFGLTEVPFFAIPTLGLSYESRDKKLVFANAVYATDGAGYERAEENPATYNGHRLAFTRLSYFTPSFAYRISNTLSVGGSLLLSYQGIGFESKLRAPGQFTGLFTSLANSFCEFVANQELCLSRAFGAFDDVAVLSFEVEEQFSANVHLGVLWEVKPWLTLGAVYRSPVKMNLEGDFSFIYSEEWLTSWPLLAEQISSALPGIAPVASFLLPAGDGDDIGKVGVDFTQPEHLSLGLQVILTPRLLMNLDYKYTGTSVWSAFELQFDQEIDFLGIAAQIDPNDATETSLALRQNYKNVTSYAIGLTYKWNDRLDLRVGFEDRPSAIPDDKIDFLVPFGDATLIGLGVGYKIGRSGTLDLAVARLTAASSSAAGQSTNVNSFDFTSPIYNPFAGRAINTEVEALFFEATYRSEF